jgi:hypothetical protein
MKRFVVLALLLFPACISFHTKDYTYADVSPLLASGLDVSSPFCGRLPGHFDVLVTADPEGCEARRGPEGNVVEHAMSLDLRTDLAIYDPEAAAVSSYRDLCRTQSFEFDDEEIRWFTVPDGEACVIPYYQEQNDAHGAWVWTSYYYASAVVRRGRLVVNIRDQRSSDRLGTSGIDALAAEIASALAPER